MPSAPTTRPPAKAASTTSTNGPHQGAWVQAGDGSDWFYHFQEPARASRPGSPQQGRALAPALEGRNHAATPDKAARP